MDKNFAEKILELKRNPISNQGEIRKLYTINQPKNGFFI